MGLTERIELTARFEASTKALRASRCNSIFSMLYVYIYTHSHFYCLPLSVRSERPLLPGARRRRKVCNLLLFWDFRQEDMAAPPYSPYKNRIHSGCELIVYCWILYIYIKSYSSNIFCYFIPIRVSLRAGECSSKLSLFFLSLPLSLARSLSFC